MIYTYDELLEMKKKGIKLDWDTITKEQLENLFINENVPNSFIADLYEVNPSKVKYKRSKWNISMYSAKYIYQNYVKNNQELFEDLNKNSKERILKKENIDLISKAITHYIFRNGPVEDMHANKQLSQEDMKNLNKYMVNKLANLLSLALDGEWLKLELLLERLSHYGYDWDKAEINTEDIETIFNNRLKRATDEIEKDKLGV